MRALTICSISPLPLSGPCWSLLILLEIALIDSPFGRSRSAFALSIPATANRARSRQAQHGSEQDRSPNLIRPLSTALPAMSPPFSTQCSLIDYTTGHENSPSSTWIYLPASHHQTAKRPPRVLLAQKSHSMVKMSFPPRPSFGILPAMPARRLPSVLPPFHSPCSSAAKRPTRCSGRGAAVGSTTGRTVLDIVHGRILPIS